MFPSGDICLVPTASKRQPDGASVLFRCSVYPASSSRNYSGYATAMSGYDVSDDDDHFLPVDWKTIPTQARTAAIDLVSTSSSSPTPSYSPSPMCTSGVPITYHSKGTDLAASQLFFDLVSCSSSSSPLSASRDDSTGTL